MADQKRFPSGSGGRKRARVIDDNVSAMATGRRAPSPGSAVRSSTAGRTPAAPSSYAPSGDPPTTFTFGTPMQEGGKPRGQDFSDAHAAELRNSDTQRQRSSVAK